MRTGRKAGESRNALLVRDDRLRISGRRPEGLCLEHDDPGSQQFAVWPRHRDLGRCRQIEDEVRDCVARTDLDMPLQRSLALRDDPNEVPPTFHAFHPVPSVAICCSRIPGEVVSGPAGQRVTALAAATRREDIDLRRHDRCSVAAFHLARQGGSDGEVERGLGHASRDDLDASHGG